ncbi:ABC transporter ATP-binding protein [Phreatobacter stygius]|uniref:Spermidine/putrescine import ATP-binding protein PotA n=1 Tax=Phreatobacter stygius TaxID=1940610 RepID=A0A4D7B927_9HYPH|nr:ABC transporter ATP-binding protein [Phreatobacter stygius]QCI67303.1 ABC transporter ATP-binding protein [Phreatobacter stygius]
MPAKRPEASSAPPPLPDSARLVPAVQLDGVAKSFGEASALRETWLKVAPGEFVTLLGPSGCGKTTLLNLVAGFLETDAGEIFIGGDLVTETPTWQREIGVVFQNYALFPHMSVEQNIGYGLKMRGVPKAEIATRVAEALELVKLAGFGSRKPRQLSGGQQQRVALARALVIRPKVLLLDEPFSALDKNLRVAMQVELKEIQRRLGVTTIFVTHDQGEALSMSDRVVVMSQGRMHQIGTPDEVYRRPCDRFVACFVGDVNILAGSLERRLGKGATVAVGDASWAVSADALDACVLGSAIDVFARPEDIRLTEHAAPGSIAGTVAALVYQGGHVDVYVTVAEARGGRLVARLAGHEAMARFPVGTAVGVLPPAADLIAFPAEEGPPA